MKGGTMMDVKTAPANSRQKRDRLGRVCRFLSLLAVGLWLVAGCAHYPVNAPLRNYDPDAGYRGKNVVPPERSGDLFLLLSFSGGGTRAAAFSYGLLEALKETEATIDGRRAPLLDQVDAISGVSGGSFTAAYYGLFKERIFEDFQDKFLKKDIEGALASQVFFNPYNWVRLSSAFFSRSDLAAEYYHEHVFAGATFADMMRHKGPMVFINGTDIVLGTRMAFTQDAFDILCSDLTDFPVARACAASSAVPIVLTPIILKNYAGIVRLPDAAAPGTGHATEIASQPAIRPCQQYRPLPGQGQDPLPPTRGRRRCRQPRSEGPFGSGDRLRQRMGFAQAIGQTQRPQDRHRHGQR